jgi:hypothetical protein
MLPLKGSIEMEIVILEQKKFASLKEKMDTVKYRQKTLFLWLHILILMEMAN